MNNLDSNLLLKEILTIIQNEIITNNSKDFKEEKALNFLDYNNLKDSFDTTVSLEGTGNKGLIENIHGYLKYSVNTSSLNFANQLWSGRNLPALIGEFITSLRNTSIYTFETAPVATLIEQEIIKFMCQKIGYDSGDGTFLTGGSNANLVSLIIARNTMFPDIKTKGLANAPKLRIFVSERAHYSFDKAVNALGHGTDSLIKVKNDDNYQMDLKDLEEQIKNCLNNGETPFYIGATAGTTETGAFDPIEKIVKIAKKYNLWLHVDGAWGGSTIISQKYRDLVKGIDKADSVAWDAHKLMGIPLICSALLLKDNNNLYEAVSVDNADYIFHEEEGDFGLDLGKKSIQCGRRVDSLKLWLALNYYGVNEYSKKIDKLIDISKYMTEKIIENTELELLAPTKYCNVNFRYKGSKVYSNQTLNKINLDSRNQLYKSGKMLFNYCYLKNRTLSIRYVVSNFDISEDYIDYFLNTFIAKCKEIEHNLQ